LEAWQRASHSRRDVLPLWSRRIAGIFASGVLDRPYCFTRNLYFRESVIIPYDVAIRIGLIDARVPKPAWICALTTEAHVKQSFDRGMKDRLKRRKKLPRAFINANRWYLAIMKPVYEKMIIDAIAAKRGRLRSAAGLLLPGFGT
jgi:hypothetical protein